MDDRPRLQLITLTRLWQYPRYLHNLSGLRLYTPISFRALGYSAAVFGPAWVILAALNVPVGGPAMLARFLLPGLLVWWALRQVGDGARPVDTAAGWARLGWAWTGRGRFTVGGSVRIRSRARWARG